MTKHDLINQLASDADITFQKAAIVVDTIFDSMKNALMQNDRIEIRGFGTFTMKDYGAYIGRNPRNGKPINVQEKRMPFFRAGKPLADIIKSRRSDSTNEESKIGDNA